MDLRYDLRYSYLDINQYLQKAIEKRDAIYNLDNLREGKVGPLETASANFWGYFGMYAGRFMPMIITGLAAYKLLKVCGVNDSASAFGMLFGGVVGLSDNLGNLSMKAGAVVGSITGAAVGRTIDYILFTRPYSKKL